MKARDLIQLFEYGKAFNRSSEPKRKKAKKAKKDMTFKEYLEFEAKLEQFQKYKKEKEDEKKKLDKMKEIKKDGVSPVHIAMFLIASFPITAPAYVYFFKQMLEAMK